tara:strand:+ start:392 stop:613 length:222 start_codon:yes stop_codon:yes gene_type:complete
MKRRIGDNSDPSVAALWNKLNEARELLNKSIYQSVFSGGNPHKHKPEIKESRRLSFNALHKIEKVLKEVEDEK